MTFQRSGRADMARSAGDRYMRKNREIAKDVERRETGEYYDLLYVGQIFCINFLTKEHSLGEHSSLFMTFSSPAFSCS